jgi:hypothetical protein
MSSDELDAAYSDGRNDQHEEDAKSLRGVALFQLAADYRAAAMKLDDMDLDAQTVSDTLDSLTGDIEVKAQNVAMFAKSLEATADAIKQHEEAQARRRKAIESRAAALRDYIARCMEATGLQRIEAPALRLSFRKVSCVVIDGMDLLPAEFVRKPEPPQPEPDKRAIAAAIGGGREVPGAHIETRKSLQIT